MVRTSGGRCCGAKKGSITGVEDVLIDPQMDRPVVHVAHECNRLVERCSYGRSCFWTVRGQELRRHFRRTLDERGNKN